MKFLIIINFELVKIFISFLVTFSSCLLVWFHQQPYTTMHCNGNSWSFLPVCLHQRPSTTMETYEVFCLFGFISNPLQQWKLIKFSARVASSATIRPKMLSINQLPPPLNSPFKSWLLTWLGLSLDKNLIL